MPVASPSSRSVRALLHDNEGAILVVGVVMGTLLVGGLWHIVSVGDAILWREHLQDSADAAAYETAVWNARGMNVIVFLNIVMAAAMSILVILRGAEIFLKTLSGLLTAALVACLVPTGLTWVLCNMSLQARNTVDTALNTVTRMYGALKPPIHGFIEGVQTAQEVVATVVPLIGVKESVVRVGVDYGIPTVGLSPLLIPVDEAGRMGRGISLPVSEGQESTLCGKAGAFAFDEISAFVESQFGDNILAAGAGQLGDIAGTIAGNMPAVFCGSRSTSEIASLTDTFQDVASEQCAGARDEGRVTDDSDHADEERQQLERFQDYWEESDFGGYVFNSSDCEEAELRRETEEYEPDRGFKPAAVWGNTQNGDFFMQAWGFAYRDPPYLAGDDEALSIPAEEALEEADPQTLGTAQAEMYWAAGPGSGCDGGAWNDCKAQAMWLMRWRARMRRVHNPVVMAEEAVVRIAVNELVGVVQSGIQRVAGRAEGRLANWARGGRLERISHFLRGDLWSSAYRERSRVGVDPAGWVQNSLNEALAADPPPPEDSIIH